MMPVTLIADSGATKAEWCLLDNSTKKIYVTQGISQYFLSTDQIANLITNELASKLKNKTIEKIFYYGTGCANPQNVKNIKAALKQVFAGAEIWVDHDLTAAARSVCGY